MPPHVDSDKAAKINSVLGESVGTLPPVKSGDVVSVGSEESYQIHRSKPKEFMSFGPIGRAIYQKLIEILYTDK